MIDLSSEKRQWMGNSGIVKHGHRDIFDAGKIIDVPLAARSPFQS